jgi:hypothetical protein
MVAKAAQTAAQDKRNTGTVPQPKTGGDKPGKTTLDQSALGGQIGAADSRLGLTFNVEVGNG